MAAGAVVDTHSAFDAGNPNGVKVLTLAWTSDGSGNVNGILSRRINGRIVRIETDPGTPAPTDNYDAVLLDSGGVDVAQGGLANRDTVTSENITPVVETVVGANTYGNLVWLNSQLELRITNAGASKQGRVLVSYL